MTYENYIKGRLVDFAVDEAYHYGGTDCMLAVAQVIANRVKAGWGEWKKVLDTAPNYVGTTVREWGQSSAIDPKDLTFRRMLTMIDDVYQGTSDDSNVNLADDRGPLTALYYADLSNIDRKWFLDNVTQNLDRHPRLATVGPLSFFA
jgi:hypothetical protein